MPGVGIRGLALIRRCSVDWPTHVQVGWVPQLLHTPRTAPYRCFNEHFAVTSNPQNGVRYPFTIKGTGISGHGDGFSSELPLLHYIRMTCS